QAVKPRLLGRAEHGLRRVVGVAVGGSVTAAIQHRKQHTADLEGLIDRVGVVEIVVRYPLPVHGLRDGLVRVGAVCVVAAVVVIGPWVDPRGLAGPMGRAGVGGGGAGAAGTGGGVGGGSGAEVVVVQGSQVHEPQPVAGHSQIPDRVEYGMVA